MDVQSRRVALVTHDLALGGGTATVVAFLHRVLSDAEGYTPEIVSLAISSRDDLSVRLIAPSTWKHGIQVRERTWRDLSYKHFGSRFTEFEFQHYKSRPVLTEYLNQFDIIQIVDGTPAWGGVALQCRKPVAVFTATTIKAERETYIEDMQGAKRYVVQAMTEFNERTEKRVLRRADCVFAESLTTLRRIKPLVRKNRLLLGAPGVDTQFFHRGDLKPDNYILAVGRFSDPRKNVRMLLEAYAHLCANHSDTPRLVLVGESPNEENLQLLHDLNIVSRVEVQANVSQDVLAALYRGAGLFVLSSNEEGLGIVILEAMASGLPVVSTDCGGPATAVSEGKTGFLTPVGDTNALADAMQRILENPSLAEQMGQQGWEVAQEQFSLEATGRVYLDRYEELVKSAR